jgi:serine/threonine-protein kinase
MFEVAPQTAGDIGVLELASPPKIPGGGPRRPTAIIKTTFSENNAETSPDGRWIAYQSNESGQNDVYVRPFPKVNDGRWQVSTGGGSRPVWARNGRELFYLDGNNLLTAVAVETTGATFTQGNPVKVLSSAYFTGIPQRSYDVTADGQKFLMIKDAASGDRTSTSASLVVVLNWFEELKARVPAK